MFKNKIVLITGGSAGIGAATAEKFAQEGASIAVVGRNDVRLKEVAEICQKHGAQVLTIKADVSKNEEVDEIVKKTIENFGKLDILINNAGIFRVGGVRDDNFLEIFDEVMNINMRGTARITHHAVPYIIQTKGNIVNVSSIAGLNAKKPNTTAYKTSKSAMSHFTRCCASELAEYGVRVNSISPGPVDTNIFEGTNLFKSANDLAAHTALKRVSESEEIADLIIYMASDKAKSITGSDYVIDNGRLLL